MIPTPLRVAIRALITKTGQIKAKQAPPPGSSWPETALILDTETTTDPSQRLLFGVYRFGKWRDDGSLHYLEEGLFYDDDLPALRPEEFQILCGYVESHRHASVGEGELQFMSRRAFVNGRLWEAVDQGSLIAGFNLPFDLSRLAIGAGVPQPKMFQGGFSQALFDWESRDGDHREDKYRPRFRFKPIDRKRSLMGWTGYRGPTGPDIPRPHGLGPLLDLKALTFAITGVGHSLASAAREFGLPCGKQAIEGHGQITPAYVGYGRQDVAITAELLVALRREWDRNPVCVSPMRALSPATLAKGYLRAMGIQPPLSKSAGIGPAELGSWMHAYYGGRAEVRVRRIPVPVVYLDFLSMYPTVNVLLGLWKLVTAKAIETGDATARVRQLLARISLEECFDPNTWPALCFIARILPTSDILPVRACYDPASLIPSIGVNPITAEEDALWAVGPDLVASVLLTGRVPEVLEARELTGTGQQDDLQPVRIRNQVPVDPRSQDFLKILIEIRAGLKRTAGRKGDREAARLQVALKVIASVTGYGVFAQLDRPPSVPAEAAEAATVFGINGPFASQTRAIEEPGEFFFPPFASLITAGARLMLAMLERMVSDAGGVIAFGDTDSAAVVSSQGGGAVPCPTANGQRIRALTWVDVQGIVAAFTKLNPYDREAVPGSILKIESVNYVPGTEDLRPILAYAISAKRYALFQRAKTGAITILAAKEHGLGHLIRPVASRPEGTDGVDEESDDDAEDGQARPWVRELVWEPIIRQAYGARLNLSAATDLPAVSRIGITRTAFWLPFEGQNAGKPYADQIKPMNFGLSVQVAPFGHPPGVDPAHFHLFAPYEPDPARWLDLPWTDKFSGKQFQLGVGPCLDAGVVRVKSLADVIEEYATHPEVKSLGPDGRPCTRRTVGLLSRRPVDIAEIVHIGKESNQFEEVEFGLVHDPSEVLEQHLMPNSSRWARLVVPVLRQIGTRRLARVSQCSTRHCRYLVSGEREPSPEVAQRLWCEALRWARRTADSDKAEGDQVRLARRLLAAAAIAPAEA